MQEWVIRLDSALPAQVVGRKAAALSRLIEAGFPVPNSIGIPTDVLRNASANRAGELCLPDGLLEILAENLSMDVPLAVRSSAVQEDMPETSLAGRFTTHLNITGLPALERAVLDCWRSYLTTSSTGADDGLAVLIQPLLDAECAGVSFTVDPVRLQPDHLLVVSAWGLGAGVVSGSIPTDTIRLRRQDLQAEEISIADKHTAVRPAAGEGVAPVSVSSELCRIPCLPDSWLRRIAEYALAVEQVFGAPQDIEWAIAGGQIWILQSRPITALPVDTREAVRYPVHWANAEEPRHYWWLERARDGGGPLLPAEIDFTWINLRGGHDAVYYGGSNQTRWRKEVNGRIYMTVAKPPHSSGHARVYSAASRHLYERLREQEVTPWDYWGSEVVRATTQLAAFDAREADGHVLADHLEEAIATANRHWMLHTMAPGRPIRDAALLDAYAHIAERRPEELTADIPFLLTGTETIQTRLIETLYELANLAKEFPEEAEALVLDRAERRPALPNLQSFALTLQRLVADYGDRLCYCQIPGYPVPLPLTWREAPEHIWELINAYMPLARQGGPSLREVRMQAKNTVDQRVEALCANALEHGVASELVNDFLSKLAYARRNAIGLDEHNHYIDQLSEGQFIQAFLYAGRWLAAQGSLPGPFDVFWLNSGEVLAALRGSPGGLDVVVAARQAEFIEWQKLRPLPCLGLPTPELPERPVLPLNSDDSTSPSLSTSANSIRGEPASRGRAVGQARMILGDNLPADIARSDILVAPFAGPVLIPLLPAIAAVVLDYGGPGDHFAITAREFGVPAVCGTLHATQLIPEGATVTIDAESGLVVWE